jgi:hypothetical protein
VLPAPDLHVIRSDQNSVVTQAAQPAIDLALLALIESQSAVAQARLAATGAQARVVSTGAAEVAARNRLTQDRSSLRLAAGDDQRAQADLAKDRARLRSIALGLYTGAITGPTPDVLTSLPTSQEAAIDSGIANVVAETVVKGFTTDLTVSSKAGRRHRHMTSTVASDQQHMAKATDAAATAAALVPPATAKLTAAERLASADQRRLVGARTKLGATLAALTGPASATADGLSLMGPAALDAGQLVAWYNDQGYVDLTASTITQLATWYLHAGALEGIRGDVAFAQAVLETGGFSSPDSVDLNNYAGIGHCDSCAAGWGFPSPQAGVTGQMQLLRIFAGAGPAPSGAPAPVLPALTPARQGRSGCCPTWESLTGVWATDPSYGTDILTLYEGMLMQAATPKSPPRSGA